ncbi:hypothetical protein HD806DRAFT_517109 [Xylariaceae sp. AK1471]|nr:hypothetical protein HD806DRAFT_517109 [Xylariaceae sp. AK1471]
MAAARPALSAAGCSHCRSLVLNLFASTALRSTPVVRSSLSSTRAHTVSTLPIRRFSSFPKPNSPISDAEHGQNTRVVEEELENNDDEVASNDSEPANVPWYLQVEPPTHVAPMEPPPLPEIPPDAPPFIASLLEYASEEMGLDALSLLDLRKLDPPPALGPNLFMLFGTARSERHLNVSAGRLVRWLRAKHRIHADADGLLGPNERKTKLRRKARRAKLLGTMGTDEGDDGIRTGWICVNLGTVDRGGPESAVISEDGRVSGFGISQAGSTVVVQIMTESRRAEMGLETLWTNALDGFISPTSESGSISEDKKSIAGAKSGSNLYPEKKAITASFHRPSKTRSTSDDKSSILGVESESKMHPVEKAMLANLHNPSSLPDDRKRQSSGVNQIRFYSTQQPLRPSAPGVDPLSTSSPEELARVLAYDAHQKQRMLELLRTQLDEMDARAVRATLALAESDEVSLSSPFMGLMELAMQTLSPSRTWEYRLAVQHKASVSGHPSTIQSLSVRLLVEELRIYAIQATRDQYLQLLFCIFHSSQRKLSVVLELALDVINTMHQRNQSIMASDLIVTIIEGASQRNDDRRWATELTDRLEKLLFQPQFPCMDDQLLMRLMTARARQTHWSGVWNAWRTPPRYLRPRSANMYRHIFRLAAASRSRGRCTEVLRRCIPEMLNEEPPVLPVGDVREAALACIQIVDPLAQEYAGTLPADSRGHMGRLANREFVKLIRMITGS